MTLNYQQLKYFETVAQTKHITKAAQQLFISQSALSRSISNLEEEIGVPLLEKYGRNIQLTRYGMLLRDYIKRGMKEFEEGIQTIQSMANVQTGTIVINSLFTMGADYIPKCIKSFIDLHPDNKIIYHQKATTEILRDLVEGNIDLGFCGEFIPSEEFSYLLSECVLTEELYLVAPLNHRLASRKSIDISEVLNEPFIGYNDFTGIRISIENILKQNGYNVKLNVRYRAAEDNTITGLVRAGLGVAFIANVPTICTLGLAKIRIEHPFFYRKLYMVWNNKRYMSPAAKAFKYHILSTRSPNISF